MSDAADNGATVASPQGPTLSIVVGDQPLREWSLAELRDTLPAAQLADVSQLDPRRQGAAVKLSAVLAASGQTGTWDSATLFSAEPGYSVQLPASVLLEQGWIVHTPAVAGATVSLRLIIPHTVRCGEAAVDNCANVKQLCRIVLHPAGAAVSESTDMAVTPAVE